MAFGREKLDVYRAAIEYVGCSRKSASEGMLFATNRANTERKKSTPIPTPTPKEAMTGNRQPPGGDGIPRLRRDVRQEMT